jgi:sensor domain CHASE-containing protein
MSIVKRTILVACCTFLALLVLVIIISDAVYLNGYQKIEKQTVEKNVNRVTEALSARLSALSTFCYDWAAWDDTYQFAQEYNQEYIDRNFQTETLNSSKLNFILILNSSGEMVAGKAFDLSTSEEIALPDDLPVTLSDEGLVNP